jgi:hypothetical protein
METKINIEIKLKDGKTLKLDYDDGEKLFDELKKVYEKEQTYVPMPYQVIETPIPFKPFFDQPDYIRHPWVITCNAQNSSIS